MNEADDWTIREDVEEARQIYMKAVASATAVIGSLPDFAKSSDTDLRCLIFVLWCDLTNTLADNGWPRDELAAHVQALNKLRKLDA